MHSEGKDTILPKRVNIANNQGNKQYHLLCEWFTSQIDFCLFLINKQVNYWMLYKVRKYHETNWSGSIIKNVIESKSRDYKKSRKYLFFLPPWYPFQVHSKYYWWTHSLRTCWSKVGCISNASIFGWHTQITCNANQDKPNSSEMRQEQFLAALNKMLKNICYAFNLKKP